MAAAVDAFRDEQVLRGALSYYKALRPGHPLYRQKIGVPALVVGGTDEAAFLEALLAFLAEENRG